jgi:hypothetical protein
MKAFVIISFVFFYLLETFHWGRFNETNVKFFYSLQPGLKLIKFRYSNSEDTQN